MPQAESTKPVATLAPAAPQSDNVRVKNDHQIPGMFVVADYNQFLTFLVQADDKRDTPVIDGSI